MAEPTKEKIISIPEQARVIAKIVKGKDSGFTHLDLVSNDIELSDKLLMEICNKPSRYGMKVIVIDSNGNNQFLDDYLQRGEKVFGVGNNPDNGLDVGFGMMINRLYTKHAGVTYAKEKYDVAIEGKMISFKFINKKGRLTVATIDNSDIIFSDRDAKLVKDLDAKNKSEPDKPIKSQIVEIGKYLRDMQEPQSTLDKLESDGFVLSNELLTELLNNHQAYNFDISINENGKQIKLYEFLPRYRSKLILNGDIKKMQNDDVSGDTVLVPLAQKSKEITFGNLGISKYAIRNIDDFLTIDYINEQSYQAQAIIPKGNITIRPKNKSLINQSIL